MDDLEQPWTASVRLNGCCPHATPRRSKDAPTTVHAFFPNLDLRHMQNNSWVTEENQLGI
jgi:hypothetical protein